MGRPRLIILVRHAQSEGNKNRDIHQTTPDHRVKLTSEGWKQAEAAGRKLRSLLSPNDTLHFFTSPYRRARETAEGILNTLTSSAPTTPNEPTRTAASATSSPAKSSSTTTPFPRHTIKVYEEPRLREQDFGNFQPSSAEMSRMWAERASYGHFFYRIPNGESAADAYDRISGFNESLWRSFSEDDFASVCILVTHGLMARVFLMKWYHFSVEYFEDLRNVEHCEFIVLKLDPQTGRYRLMNDLRTWSQLRREREERERVEQGGRTPDSPVPVRKKWNGCMEPEVERGWEEKGGGQMGDDFARRQARRRDTSDLFAESPASPPSTSEPPQKEQQQPRQQARPSSANEPSAPSLQAPRPHPLPLPPHVQADYLSVGRDGGGSRSGASSPALPTLENSAGMTLRPPGKSSLAQALAGQLETKGPDPSSPWADALGDQSDADDDTVKPRGSDVEALQRAEMSVDGSVR